MTVDLVAIDGGTVTLTLASSVSAGAAVTVSYARPSGANGNRLRDRFGNQVADFTGQAVETVTALPVVSIAACGDPGDGRARAAAFTLTRTGSTAAGADGAGVGLGGPARW